ncbi:MAG: selenide, water dikinase SelD, partial [Elainella sp.]
DIGSTPLRQTVPGAAEYTIPVKPIAQFLSQWDQIVRRIEADPEAIPQRMVVVGGGAGGVELTLAIQARLKQLMRYPPELHLVHRGGRLIPERPAAVGQRLGNLLAERGVMVHLNETVAEITAPTAVKKIRCASGLVLEADLVFWVTQAAAAPWLAEAGLATDEHGFVWVNSFLQSVSHPQVFAAGDVASMQHHERPKAGVFAVRQGKPLVDNLRRALQNQPLQSFVPQKEFLILVGTGDRSALASRGQLSLGPLPQFWSWKDQIDRQFMAQFTDLKPMELAGSDAAPMPCAGCGSKASSTVLEQALSRIRQDHSLTRPDVLIGLEQGEDAAVLRVPAQQVMVQTVDQFRALLSDPFVFGQICAHHCLSDLFAMAATPQSALAIVILPYATPAKQAELLYQLLAGAVQVLSEAGAALVGGHTTTGPELSFGLTCNGLAEPDQLWQKGGMAPQQAVILTKSLGIGTLFAADMQLRAKGRWIETAIASMLQSNQAAAAVLRQQGATACTDVTGFGLLGHLVEMVVASGQPVQLDLEALPLLPGAEITVAQGLLSSLHPQNLLRASHIRAANLATQPRYPLLFDPQTSGGLLATVPLAQAEATVQALRQCGYSQAAVIGRTVELGQMVANREQDLAPAQCLVVP